MATKQVTRSGRYTPPKPKSAKRSPLWVPAVMGTALLTGVAVIVLNYLGLLPGDAENRYLFLGLGLVVLGFALAANYR
jgi:Cell division protein CrgA